MVECLSESEFDREQTNINLTTKWVFTNKVLIHTANVSSSILTAVNTALK